MPLKPSDIWHQLQAKREQFKVHNQETLKYLQQYRAALKRFSQLSKAEWKQRVNSLPPLSGAVPIESFTDTQQGAIAHRFNWSSREESLAWVRDQIEGVATFAVDGSQIYPSKDISLLVALVQVGWYENLHKDEGAYTKDIEVEVMTPTDLAVEDRRELVDRKVNMRRFQMETDRLVRYIEAHEGDERCLVFLDGSLVATFAEAFDLASQKFYVACLMRLLDASQTFRVPLVGYVDTSYARDLTTMIQQMEALPDVESIHDAQILNTILKNRWGDRTPLCKCDRAGILREYSHQQDQITFTYLKTNQGYPARLELPAWIYKAGRLEQIIDWVRCEVVIGGGYPYVIETADQTAVLQAADRHTFYRILQDWAETEQLNLRLSRKMVSKARRR